MTTRDVLHVTITVTPKPAPTQLEVKQTTTTITTTATTDTNDAIMMIEQQDNENSRVGREEEERGVEMQDGMWEDRMDPVMFARYYADQNPHLAKIVQDHNAKMCECLDEGIASWMESVQLETV